jgi:hypothetical protein
MSRNAARLSAVVLDTSKPRNTLRKLGSDGHCKPTYIYIYIYIYIDLLPLLLLRLLLLLLLMLLHAVWCALTKHMTLMLRFSTHPCRHERSVELLRKVC